MKTYGVQITAGGTTYNFHCDTASKVRELVDGSTDVTALVVYEETHEHTAMTYRIMSDTEILHTIFLANTARSMAEAA